MITGIFLDHILTGFGTTVIYYAGGNAEEVTPGSISNPEVKLFKADDTALVREWESRKLPVSFFFS